MNYSSFIVKIVEEPIQSYFEDGIPMTEIIVKFSQIRKRKTIQTFRISIWGNLADDVIKYYQINDYIVIEGYISIRPRFSEDNIFSKNNQVEVSIRKIYPFLLSNIKLKTFYK